MRPFPISLHTARLTLRLPEQRAHRLGGVAAAEGTAATSIVHAKRMALAARPRGQAIKQGVHDRPDSVRRPECVYVVIRERNAR